MWSFSVKSNFENLQTKMRQVSSMRPEQSWLNLKFHQFCGVSSKNCVTGRRVVEANHLCCSWNTWKWILCDYFRALTRKALISLIFLFLVFSSLSAASAKHKAIRDDAQAAALKNKVILLSLFFSSPHSQNIDSRKRKDGICFQQLLCRKNNFEN